MRVFGLTACEDDELADFHAFVVLILEEEIDIPDRPDRPYEGCHYNEWKRIDNWPAPYTRDMLFSEAFDSHAFPGKTLEYVLEKKGGGIRHFGRHTVAALLNAASEDVNYKYSVDEVIDAFNDVFPGGGSFDTVKKEFEAQNKLGCDVDNDDDDDDDDEEDEDDRRRRVGRSQSRGFLGPGRFRSGPFSTSNRSRSHARAAYQSFSTVFRLTSRASAISGFFQTGDEAQLENARLAFIEFGELGERLVEGQHVDLRSAIRGRIGQRDALTRRRSFLRALFARVIDQDLAHRARRDREKVRPVLHPRVFFACRRRVSDTRCAPGPSAPGCGFCARAACARPRRCATPRRRSAAAPRAPSRHPRGCAAGSR